MLDFIKRNKDGFGFMWIQDNKVHVFKTPNSNIDVLMEKYNATKEFDPIIHFRMKTHGLIDDENTHPYYVDHGIWLMHNGVISSHANEQDDTKSDTWHFIKDVLKPFVKAAKNPHAFIRSKAFGKVMNNYLSGQRVVMMDREGSVIFNQSSWHEVNNPHLPELKGMLVSNTYAWSASSFGAPVQTYPVVTHYNTNHRTYPGSYSVGLDRRPIRDQMTRLYENSSEENNIYYDSIGYVWEEYAMGCYRRRADLDSKGEAALASKKNSADANGNVNVGSTTNNSPSCSSEQLSSDLHQPIDDGIGYEESEEEHLFNVELNAYVAYRKELFNKWKKYNDEEIETAFWTDYDEALIILKEGLHHASV